MPKGIAAHVTYCLNISLIDVRLVPFSYVYHFYYKNGVQKIFATYNI